MDTPVLGVGPALAATEADHDALRVDLAAAFRWFARLNMHESVANHLSAAVSARYTESVHVPAVVATVP